VGFLTGSLRAQPFPAHTSSPWTEPRPTALTAMFRDLDAGDAECSAS